MIAVRQCEKPDEDQIEEEIENYDSPLINAMTKQERGKAHVLDPEPMLLPQFLD